jgi:hypothetical protein
MYRKQRKDWYTKTEDMYEEIDPSHESPATEIEEPATTIRTSSRYLQALFRHQRERQRLVEIMYNGEKAPFRESVELLTKMSTSFQETRYYPGVNPPKGTDCPHCKKKAGSRADRMHGHLLRCTRRTPRNYQFDRMQLHFQDTLRVCRWDRCNFPFKSKSGNIYSEHITRHLQIDRSHRCLWEGCNLQTTSIQDLSMHISQKHQVPCDWTILTKWHFCFEHAQWFMLNHM